MAKKNNSITDFENKRNTLLEKISSLLKEEGFDDFDVKRLDVSFGDCSTVTKEYCESKGMKRKRAKQGDNWICYCVLK